MSPLSFSSSRYTPNLADVRTYLWIIILHVILFYPLVPLLSTGRQPWAERFAAGCRPCTTYHVQAGRLTGASDEQLRQVVSDALRVRQSATEMVARWGTAQCFGVSLVMHALFGAVLGAVVSYGLQNQS